MFLIHAFRAFILACVCTVIPTILESAKSPTLPLKIPQSICTQLRNPQKNHPILGSPCATMVLVLFVEPYCALCYESFLDAKQYVQNHKNIKIIIQHFPIYGKYSYLTTCALLAAHQYGQYTPYKKRLHEKSEKDIPTYEELLGIAKELGIQPKAFEAKLRSIEVRDIVRESLSLVKALKIDATPTYVLLHPKLKQPKIIVGLEKISEVIKPDTL